MTVTTDNNNNCTEIGLTAELGGQLHKGSITPVPFQAQVDQRFVLSCISAPAVTDLGLAGWRCPTLIFNPRTGHQEDKQSLMSRCRNCDKVFVTKMGANLQSLARACVEAPPSLVIGPLAFDLAIV